MKPAILGVYPPCFFLKQKNNNQKKTTNPSKRHRMVTLKGRTLGVQPSVWKQTGTSPSLSPTEVRLGTIDFGSASLSGTDVGSTARVPVRFIWLRFFGCGSISGGPRDIRNFCRCLSRKNGEKNKTWTETIDAYRFEGWYFGWCFQPKWKM